MRALVDIPDIHRRGARKKKFMRKIFGAFEWGGVAATSGIPKRTYRCPPNSAI
jgi:hypothetical protein